MHNLEYLFHPRSIAVVGLSPGNWGWVWSEVLQEIGFAGNLYLVNPRLSEFMGLKDE
jgi:acyl-CoA synthetase (NDP forming)